MKVLDITEIKLERLDMGKLHQHAWTPYEQPPNTIGAATVVRYIAKKIGKFTADDSTDEMGLRVLVGMGWEVMVAQLYPDMWWQPGVYELDGICGHPDGFGEVERPAGTFKIDTGAYIYEARNLPTKLVLPVVDEFKYTAKSLRKKGALPDVNKDIREEWMWMSQVMAYAKLDPREPLHARIHVCWAMNNYTRYTLDERYLRYLVEFERREVEQNWLMLVNHRDEARKELGHA